MHSYSSFIKTRVNLEKVIISLLSTYAIVFLVSVLDNKSNNKYSRILFLNSESAVKRLNLVIHSYAEHLISKQIIWYNSAHIWMNNESCTK